MEPRNILDLGPNNEFKQIVLIICVWKKNTTQIIKGISSFSLYTYCLPLFSCFLMYSLKTKLENCSRKICCWYEKLLYITTWQCILWPSATVWFQAKEVNKWPSIANNFKGWFNNLLYFCWFKWNLNAC